MKLSDFTKIFRLSGDHYENVTGRASLSRIGFRYRQSTPISLATLKHISDVDENVALAGSSVAEAVAGNGFELVIEGKGLSEQVKEKAQDLCRQFAYDCDLDQFNLETVKEFVTIGVSFTEKIFAPAAMSSINRKDLVKIARLPIEDNWQVQMPQLAGGPDFVKAIQNSTKEFTPDELMLWRTNRTSTSEFYGRGICWYLAQEKNYWLEFADGTSKEFKVPPLYVVLWALQDDLRLAAHHMTPKSIINAKGQSDGWVTTNAPLVNNMNAGEAFLTNVKGGIEIATVQADPRFRVDAMLNYYDQVLMRAVQTPSPAMYSKEGYSGIFGEQIMQQFGRKIIALRRYTARKLERELFAQVLKQNGIDSRLVRPRIIWHNDIKKISQLQDFVALFTNEKTAGDFTPEERRAIYKQYGIMGLSDTPPKSAYASPVTTTPASKDEATNDNE